MIRKRNGVIGNTFGVSVNTFGVSVNTFGVSVNTFGVSVNTFGVSVNTFGVSVNTFGVSEITPSLTTTRKVANRWTCYQLHEGNTLSTTDRNDDVEKTVEAETDLNFWKLSTSH